MLDRTGWLLVLLAGCGAAAAGAPDSQVRVAKREVPAGAKVYEAECASCHGDRGQGSAGNPPVMGPGALPVERGDRPALRTAADLHGYVKAKMPLPPQFAGSLSDAEYWAVTEFLLRGQGAELPQGGLSAATAAGIAIHP